MAKVLVPVVAVSIIFIAQLAMADEQLVAADVGRLTFQFSYDHDDLPENNKVIVQSCFTDCLFGYCFCNPNDSNILFHHLMRVILKPKEQNTDDSQLNAPSVHPMD
ncbi:hypothetical protein ACH5RR_032700 [Cinchona calisaya]|uniref:Uncharacterized protein n=1 Tax=Cinchona calisaya TaxID=153742 RepID=A0ABD2YP52_9GENT